MKISKTNYFSVLKKIGTEKLPETLKSVCQLIGVKTDNGTDWSLYNKDKDFKRLANLAFSKLGEFISSKKTLSGTPENKENMEAKKKNPYTGIVNECYFIDRYLSLHDKIIYKNTLGIFIDDLQKAIKAKRITKKSVVAKEINEIQDDAIKRFNSMYNAKLFTLQAATIKRFKTILEKYNNAYEDIDVVYANSKKQRVDLNGLNGATAVRVISSKEYQEMNFPTIGFKGKWLSFFGDPCHGFRISVSGMPKMGKSYFCVDFADYLAQNHGPVLYITKEEFLSPTFQLKLLEKNNCNGNFDVAGGIPSDLSAYTYIFLDSVTSMKLSADDLKKLEEKNPGKNFIYVSQVTKAGKARGTNEFLHNVDMIVDIPEKGKAVQYGRYNQGGAMDIFPAPEAGASQGQGEGNLLENQQNKT